MSSRFYIELTNLRENLCHISRLWGVTSLVRTIWDLLWFLRLQTRLALTPEQINDACYVDINANKTVFDSLRKNPKVHYDGKRFSYKVIFYSYISSMLCSRRLAHIWLYHRVLIGSCIFLIQGWFQFDLWLILWFSVQAWFEGQRSTSLFSTEISRGHCCYWSQGCLSNCDGGLTGIRNILWC